MGSVRTPPLGRSSSFNTSSLHGTEITFMMVPTMSSATAKAKPWPKGPHQLLNFAVVNSCLSVVSAPRSAQIAAATTLKSEGSWSCSASSGNGSSCNEPLKPPWICDGHSMRIMRCNNATRANTKGMIMMITPTQRVAKWSALSMTRETIEVQNIVMAAPINVATSPLPSLIHASPPVATNERLNSAPPYTAMIWPGACTTSKSAMPAKMLPAMIMNNPVPMEVNRGQDHEKHLLPLITVCSDANSGGASPSWPSAPHKDSGNTPTVGIWRELR
mmetsp:Transcript_77499/g.173735  ORF Transcript_77499/g.173735 Transcript_77499/m.173735 type:complete len:274 (+) Transcript_77499:486-1307(+)